MYSNNILYGHPRYVPPRFLRQQAALEEFKRQKAALEEFKRQQAALEEFKRQQAAEEALWQELSLAISAIIEQEYQALLNEDEWESIQESLHTFSHPKEMNALATPFFPWK